MLVDQDLWDDFKSNAPLKHNSANDSAAPATPLKLGAIFICGDVPSVSRYCWDFYIKETCRSYRRRRTLPPEGAQDTLHPEACYPDLEISLQIFLVCRQVYREASYIFYSKNRFFVHDMTTLLPFLHDRPIPARQYIHALSISVPYVKKFGKPDSYNGVIRTLIASTFSGACNYMGEDWLLMLPNLKHLDLRIIENVPADVKQLQVHHLLVKELAKIASPEVMTVSLVDWCPSRDNAPVMRAWNENSIFAPLPNDIFERIRHHHDYYVNKSKATKEPKKDAKKENNEVSHSLRPPQLQVSSALTVLQGKDWASELGDDIPAMFVEKTAVCRDVPAMESDYDDDYSEDGSEDDSDEEYDEDWCNQYEGGFQGSTMMGNLRGEL